MATMKYEEAMRQLEDIVRRLENDEMDIDVLGTELKRAQKLVKLCKEKLAKTEDDVKAILDKEPK